MGNINCKDSKCNTTTQQEEINCINSTETKPNQPPQFNLEKAPSFDIQIQSTNNDNLIILTPTKGKSIEFTSYEPNMNPLTETEPQHHLLSQQQQQATIGSLTPIRKPSTIKHSESRKMPLEVIDEINGEMMMNMNQYETEVPNSHSNQPYAQLNAQYSNQYPHQPYVNVGNNPNENAIANVNSNTQANANANTKAYHHMNTNPNPSHNANPNVNSNANAYQYQYQPTQTSTSEKRPLSVYKKKTWRDMKIMSIIPEEKLKNAGNNDILFQGEFYKFSKENDIKKIDATSKYLILTRSELRIYRSKEIVLHMLSPLQRISLFNISQCDIVTPPKQKIMKNLCKYNFCIEFITVNGMKIEGDDRLSSNSSQRLEHSITKKNTNDILLTSISNKDKDKDKPCFTNTNTNKNTNVRKGKKMQLIPIVDKPMENHIKKDKRVFDNNSELIIFSSNNEDLVHRWVCVVNYFLTR